MPGQREAEAPAPAAASSGAEAGGHVEATNKVENRVSFMAAKRVTSEGAVRVTISKANSELTIDVNNEDIDAPLGDKERKLFLKNVPAPERVIPAYVNNANKGKPNILRTTTFTPLTWLPKSLYFQFQRLANVYFAFIAFIVCLGSFEPFGLVKFSPKDWKSKLGPFILVLLWTACKDLYEDIRRKRDDDKENAQVTHQYNHQTRKFEEAMWKDIIAGDLLWIPCDGAFPADMILLQSAESQDVFVSTVMLDGETSLKEKSVPRMFAQAAENTNPADVENQGATPFAEALAFLPGFFKLECEMKLGVPTQQLADVRGLAMKPLTATTKETQSIDDSALLPRGCVLRNTPFVLGISAYVGNDSKVRLNATEAQLKFSNMQKSLNFCVRLLLVAIFTLCTYATVMSQVSAERAEYNIVIMFMRYCIAFYHGVPMSLYVVYEMLKLVLGYQVNTDPQMVWCETGESARARTADLMEEMGQVDFIFADKTGTLTTNEMIFARCHVAGKDFGEFRKDYAEGGQEPTGLAEARRIFNDNGASNERNALLWFYTCLATCHEVQIEQQRDNKGGQSGAHSEEFIYTAMSPDEVALARAAQDAGVVFVSRNRKPGYYEMGIRDATGNTKVYECHAVLQFTSERKRMSVVVMCGEEAWCITKGADSVMERLLDGGIPEAAKTDLLKFSTEGLRVLVVASKAMNSTFLKGWLEEYDNARAILGETKETRMRELVTQVESGLTFAGITAVEDRLQEGVPKAIETLKQAGSRVWILTGDKTETAVNIAYSSSLFTPTTKLIYVTGQSNEAGVLMALQRARDQAATVARGDVGLVIDGGTLLVALQMPESRALIFRLGLASKSCICTRLSPLQKLMLVELVRQADANRICLCIGDGANDVPMLLGGHVGIGIRGKEGAAAVQACDIAISQFRFLVPLLLCHGRRSYRRVAIFLCYYLYKNVVLLMADVVWMHWDNFQGRIAFPEYLSIAYNVFFTSWHILFLLGFDVDVADEVANTSPELYFVGPERKLFNAKVFGGWMCYAVLHGSVAWIIPSALYGVGGEEYDPSQPTDFWTNSCAAFTNVIHITLLKSIIMSQNPGRKRTLLPSFAAWVMFVVYLILLGYTPWPGRDFQPSMWHIPETMFTNVNGVTWAWLLITPVLALLVDVAERLGMYYFNPTLLQTAKKESRASKAK